MSLIDELEELAANYKLVMDPVEARNLLRELGSKVVALDFETTGLDPQYARVRLSCIYHPEHGIYLLDHDFCGKFTDLAPLMLGPMWAVYNAKFEVRWFDYIKSIRNQVDLIDVDFLAKAKRGGSHSSLKVMAKRDLKIDLDKEEQLSDWSAPRLSHSQLCYAAMDALVTYKIYEHWIEQLTPEQREAAFTMQDAVRPTVECEEIGLDLDYDLHLISIQRWKMKQENALRAVRRITPPSVINNLNSNKQISDFLKTQLGRGTLQMWPKTAKTEQLSLDRKVISDIAKKSPYPFSRWLNALILYRFYGKYLSTYGETLLTKKNLEDKITYRLNIAQAATCRYSSSSINIQNIPRAPYVRRAFLKPQEYDELVIADYSGIEVRVLAELSQDPQLLADSIYGDVHASSAAAIYKVDEDEFKAIVNEKIEEGEQHSPLYYDYKEKRSLSKGFTFQNVYGAQAAALSLALKCTVPEAEAALRTWAARYPKAYNYRFGIADAMTNTGYIPVVDGRTIFVHKNDRTIPVASNYGVQGAAASVMMRAMHHVYTLREQESRRSLIGLCATVHDEMLLGAKNGHIDHAQAILKRGMELGWLDVFPGSSIDNLIGMDHGLTWADAK